MTEKTFPKTTIIGKVIAPAERKFNSLTTGTTSMPGTVNGKVSVSTW